MNNMLIKSQERHNKATLKEKDSKIYTIRSHQTEKYYIGSTYQPLYKRFYEHKNNFRNFWITKKYGSSYEILQYEDAYIEILEEHIGMNRHLLNKREGELIRQHKSDVVNISCGGKRDEDNITLNKNNLIIKSQEQYNNKKKF